MHHYQDPIIRCPFDRSHFMASLRFTYHHAKCELKFKKENQEKPVLHCPNNYLHIFFEADKLAAHIPQCDKMNIRQCLEPYVPDPPKRKPEFSPIQRSRSRGSSSKIPAESVRGSGREAPATKEELKER